MSAKTLAKKLEQFQAALELFLERVEDDDKVLAVVQVGSLTLETIWRRESIFLWLIESDGVSKRLRYDGNDERIFRTFVEEEINVHVELIPRSRFKLMVEGASRTAFSCNFFSKRELIYSRDPSIASWFEAANQTAVKDQEKEQLSVMTWVLWGFKHLRRRLEYQQDLLLARETLVHTAHSVAALEIVKVGEVYEDEVIVRGLELNPELLEVIYLGAVSKKPTKKFLREALEKLQEYLEANTDLCLKPLLHYLKKQKRSVPFSELCDAFAYSQLHPWHLEAACEWLEEIGQLEKVSAPFKMTKKSRSSVEEPAYFLLDS